MARFLKCLLLVFLCLALLMSAALAQPMEEGTPMTLLSPSVLLMEADTGAVIFEKNAAEQRPAASVTKLTGGLFPHPGAVADELKQQKNSFCIFSEAVLLLIQLKVIYFSRGRVAGSTFCSTSISTDSLPLVFISHLAVSL